MGVVERLTELLDADEELRARLDHAEAIADAQYLKRRREALQNPRISPLKRARLTVNGRGLSISELAEASGVSVSTIVRLEAGREGKPETWAKLGAALGVQPNRLGAR